MGPGLLSAETDTARLEERLSHSRGRERLELLVELVGTYSRREADRAIARGQEALGLLPAHPDAGLELELVSSLSRIYRGRREDESAVKHGARALQLARETDDTQRLAAALVNLGDVYRSMHEYERSLDYYLEALPIVALVDDPIGLGNLERGIGTVYRRLGNYSKALEHFFSAFRAHERAGDRPGLGWALNSLGIVYRELGQPTESLSHYQEALAIFEEEGDENAIASILNNIGSHHRRQGDPDRALEYYRRSLAIKERLGNRAGLGVQFHNIGFAHQSRGDLDQAMEYYRKALANRQEFRETKGIANTLQHIATVFHERGEYERAIEMFERSLGIARRINIRDEIQDAYRDLATTYAAMGDYRRALAASQAHERIESEIFDEKKGRVIAEMQARFEAEQKQKEIELLKQQQALDARELRRRQIAPQALAVAFLLLALVVLVGYNRYRLWARSSRIIERQNRELERSVAQLRDSEQRYRRLFDDPSLAKLLVDPESSEILAANSSAAKLLGRSPAELPVTVDPSAKPAWLGSLLARLRERRAADGQERRVEGFRLGEDRPRHFEAWASRLRIEGRDAALITLHDVTERRRLEEERLRRQERERYIAELEAKQAEVEARGVETERFAYTVSHDLKTPLVTIRGFLGLVEKDARSGEVARMRQDIGRIDGAAQRMGRLLEELLELSRIGRVRNPPVEVDLAELARRAAAEAIRPGVEIDVAPGLPVVVGDAPRLLEVFQRLIGNAIKFMGEQAAPRVEVGCRQQGQEKVIYVRDNGIGIPPLYHGKVFDLFEQLDPEATGTGIGLALTERVIEVHGGRIWVESQGAGRGSTFCFTLGRSGAENPISLADRRPRIAS